MFLLGGDEIFDKFSPRYETPNSKASKKCICNRNTHYEKMLQQARDFKERFRGA